MAGRHDASCSRRTPRRSADAATAAEADGPPDVPPPARAPAASRRPSMKLSEKLAALEEEETPARPRKAAADHGPRRPAPAPPRRAGQEPARRRVVGASRSARCASSSSPRSPPRWQGLTGDALITEVKTALDKILQREDVQVSPARAPQVRPGGHPGHARLRPARPAAAGRRPVTEIMCNAYDEIWVERGGPHRAHRPVLHRRRRSTAR